MQTQSVINNQLVSLIAEPTPNQFRVLAPLSLTTESVTPQRSNTNINVIYNGFTPQAQAAFQYAVDIWESLIESPVTITINANFTNLGAGILGSAGATNLYRDFTNAPQSNTWYSVALANSLAGTDLNTTQPEIVANFNSNFDWYYGTDGNTPINQYDFATVVLHEIGHGLGFFDLTDYNNGVGSWGLGSGFPSTYDRYLENGSGQSLIDTSLFPNPSSALGTQLTSNNIFFDGTNANTANGGNRVPIYAPFNWSGGSSIAHLGESFNNTPNALMTYSLAPGEVLHNPGPVALGILKDTGWRLANITPPEATVAFTQAAYSGAEGNGGGTANAVVATIQRTGNTTGSVTVPVLLRSPSGTATAGTDYTNVFPVNVTFSAGQTTQNVSIPIVRDSAVEANETINLQLGTPTGGVLGTQTTATYTINNDDSSSVSTIAFTQAAYSGAEGSGGGTANAVVATIQRTGNTTGAASVPVLLRTTPGTATPGTDYTNVFPVNVTFAAGQTSKNVSIPIVRDDTFEANERINLQLGTPTGGVLGTQRTATYTINNDDPRTFTNSTRINILDATQARPYPSTINVSGLSGTIQNLTVSLRSVSHTWPDDLDILLVAPTGQKALLMSDVGGDGDLNNVDLSFRASSGVSLSDSAQILSGTYRPTNFGSGDTFNSPAPVGPYTTNLSAFNGTNPNGSWRLFVMDDQLLDTGAIASGWQLSITSA